MIIWIFLAAGAAFLVVYARKRGKSLLPPPFPGGGRGGSVLFVLIAWLVVGWGSFVEPRLLVVRETPVTLGERTVDEAPLRAAVVSDLHMGPYKKSDWARRVVNKVNEQKPDILFLLGDFVSTSSEDVRYLDPLSELSAPLGVWAVTGNHEYESRAAAQTIAKLEALGIAVLENESAALIAYSREFVVAGVSDIWFAEDVSKALGRLSEDQTVILLAHNPDVVLDSAAGTADLVLAGHTHGGQIRLPWLGSVPPIPDKLGRKYDRGLFDLPMLKKLFITSGLGETGPRARLFNPPEIALLNISF